MTRPYEFQHLKGFTLVRNWAHDVRLDDVIHDVRWEQRNVKIFGREIPQPRLTAWMGSAPYTYSGQRHEPAPIPRVVDDLRVRAQDLCQQWFNSTLANLYRHGRDSVSWHADDEPELGEEPVIASLSLGAAREFWVRHNQTRDVWKLKLNHGDLLIMSGPSQRDYQHCVPKIGEIVGARINLTFRLVHGVEG